MLAERIRARCELVPAPAGVAGDCWVWTGATSDGYGRVKVGDRIVGVHQATYALLVGPVPPGLELDHLCRVRACCNPAHLDPVTHAENLRRGAEARSACEAGHPYDEANTHYERRGPYVVRRCRRCAAARARERRARRCR